MRITDIITEGYTIMPSIDPKYTVMPDMEGPFQLRNGKVVYYDPKQGQYYDRDTDQYISYEDYREMDAPTAQSNKMNQLQGRIDLIKRMIKRTNNAAKKQQLTVELQALLNDAKVNENVGAHTVKKAVKAFNRGIKGWEKGMHDVESVRAATKTLSAASKDEILRSNPPKGSPAEFQKKLIQRELKNQSETVDQRPYSVVKITDKPQIVKPTTGGESPHPYQGKLVGEDSAARNRNRKMAQATDYEQRAKETRSPIKAAHFRKMADDIRSSILADRSDQSVQIKPSPFAKVNESSPEARKAAIRAVQNSYQQIARDLIAGYGDDLDAMSALDSVMSHLEMAGDRETVSYIRGLGADLRATFAKEALGKWEGINTFAKVGATESLQKAVKNREASRKRAIARAAADLRASGGKKSVAELIKFYELFPNDAEKILQLASAQKESVQVNSTQYQFAHGKPPKGYGSWFFTRNRRGVDFRKDELNTDYIQVSMMNYADAKRAAQQWAKEKGYGMIYVAENAQHIDEVAHELGLQDHEPRVVKGVRGLKSSNFTRKFPNHAAQERWMDQNPDYEVRQVQRESATSLKDKNQSETQVASWGSSKVIHAAAGDQAHSMMLSLQNQNDLAKLSDGDYTKITDELGEPLTVSRKNQQFTLSTADGKLSVTVDAADIISLYAR